MRVLYDMPAGGSYADEAILEISLVGTVFPSPTKDFKAGYAAVPAALLDEFMVDLDTLDDPDDCWQCPHCGSYDGEVLGFESNCCEKLTKFMACQSHSCPDIRWVLDDREELHAQSCDHLSVDTENPIYITILERWPKLGGDTSQKDVARLKAMYASIQNSNHVHQIKKTDISGATEKRQIVMRWNSCGLTKKQRTIHKIDNVWIYRHYSDPNVLGHLTTRQRFREDEDEVIDYAAQVIVDMLNAGDIEACTEHLQAVRASIQPCGYTLRLGGAWNDCQFIEISEKHKLIEVMAWLRCGKYLSDAINAGCELRGLDYCPKTMVPDWWWPHQKIIPSLLEWPKLQVNGSSYSDYHYDPQNWGAVHSKRVMKNWDGYYMGADGLLLHRIAECAVDGLSIFDLDYRSEYQDVPIAVAEYLLTKPEISEALQQQARQYIQTDCQIRHYHCGSQACGSRHKQPHTRCTGVYGGHWDRSSFPCKVGYPCSLEDPAGFKKRFE